MSSHVDFFNEGNSAFVEDDYKTALQKYSSAIELEPLGQYYLKRSVVYAKLENYKDALKDADTACQLMKDNDRCFLRKGIAYFYLEEINNAKEAFSECLRLNASDIDAKSWLSKCDAKLSVSKKGNGNKDSKVEQILQEQPSGSSSLQKDLKAPLTTALMPPQSKARFDWYQTETQIILSLLIRNTKKEDVNINFTSNTVSATVKLPNGNDYSLELDLAHPVVTDQCFAKIYGSKIEIKLKKAEGIRWSSLETDNESKFANAAVSPASSCMEKTEETSARKYPSSSQTYHDWDKLASELSKEEETEKLEGDAALNQLFQKIYADGSDEVRKAMNKSFVESGGTVLSTNWGEVQKAHVDCKPPDGMEYKPYEF